MYKKEICHLERLQKYIIMVPVFYEHEEKPTWRTVYSGTRADCEKRFQDFPDRMKATEEENKENRQWKKQEMIFLESIGRKNCAEMIRKQYCF